MAFRVLKIKTATKFQPHYFFESNVFLHSKGAGDLFIDEIDLGNLFWNWVFRKDNLVEFFLNNKQDSSDNERISLQIDQAAIRSLDQAIETIRKVEYDCPDGKEMWIAFRILTRCAAIASSNMKDFKIHLSQGYLPFYNYYSLEENISEIIEKGNPVFEFAKDLMDEIAFADNYDVAVISIRNDSEFHQVLSIAKILKERFPSLVVVLCSQGGNEQLDFGSWVNLLSENKNKLGAHIDYYIPRQDYNCSLNSLIEYLQNGGDVTAISNLLQISKNELDTNNQHLVNWKETNSLLSNEKELDEAFVLSNWSQSTFYSDGKITVALRLSNERCHWAACDFCTINSQHLLKKGNKSIDSRIEFFINNTLDLIEEKKIESVIFTDEALHPKVLHLFAKKIQERELVFVYRARARFTEDFYDQEFCSLLYSSGLRYLGCGLESASPRINKLVNKHMGKELDYEKILTNMDACGIRPHIYSITNFPTETKEEITLTRDFLINAIEKYQYVTVSPNVFYLMKGSRIEENQQKYNINNISAVGNLSLTLMHDEPEAGMNRAFAVDSVQKVHLSQFSPWLSNGSEAESFWYFIDQTGIFYIQKVKFAASPYRTIYDMNIPNSDCLLESVVSMKDSFILKNSNASFLIVDWATFNYCEFDMQLFPLFKNWNSTFSVKDNLQAFQDNIESDLSGYTDILLQLINAKIFTLNSNQTLLI